MPLPSAKARVLANQLGYEVEKGEHWNSFAHIKQDFAGFGDLLLYGKKGTTGILVVQATDASHHATRIGKILESEKAKKLLIGKNRIQVWSWNSIKPYKRRITALCLDGSGEIKTRELDLPDDEKAIE